MAQPSIDGTGHGKPRMVFGSDAADHYEVYVDSEGVLRVRGSDGDKIIAFDDVVKELRSATISGAGGYVDSDAVPAGKVWKITNVVVRDATSAITQIAASVYDGATAYDFWRHIAAIGAGVYTSYSCEVWMEATDVIRVYFVGGLANDSCLIILTGIQMNAP